jgi:hypothetical protein
MLNFDKVQYGKLLIIELLSVFNFASEISTDVFKETVIKTCLDKCTKKLSNIIAEFCKLGFFIDKWFVGGWWTVSSVL